MAGPVPVHFLAGGTDLLIGARDLPEDGLLIDLTAASELSGIDCWPRESRIGAATRVAEIESHDGLAARFAALVQAAEECGSVQIRNRATLGGNIANGAPAADLLPVLALAGARLEVITRAGARFEIDLADFEQGMLIVAVIVPGPQLLPRSAFAKLGARREMTVSRLNMAAMAQFDGDRFGEIRIVAGALGPRPRRLARAETALAGRMLAVPVLREFLDALTLEVDTAIAGRASCAFKRRAIRGVGLDVLARLCGLSPRDGLFDEVV